MFRVENAQKYKAEIKGKLLANLQNSIFQEFASSHLGKPVAFILIYLIPSRGLQRINEIKNWKGTMYNISFVFCTQSFWKS